MLTTLYYLGSKTVYKLIVKLFYRDVYIDIFRGE